MALPFLNSSAKKREHIVVVDLGTRATKAVHLQRKGGLFDFVDYAILDAPVYDRSLSVELLAEHLKAVNQALGGRVKQITLAVGVNDSVLRHTEMPFIPVSDMRALLKFNAKSYLQQELPDYVYDCYILPPSGGAKLDTIKANQKVKVVVAGARRQLVEDIQAATKSVGLSADEIAPGVIGPANAFEMVEPELFSRSVVALVDLGFKSSSISILLNGEMVLTRVVGIGGDKITSGLAETMGISYAEAEGIKVGMAEEVQGIIQPLLSPLGRELRASIDFFEHQHDKAVNQIYISGGPARSPFVIETMQMELMVPCKTWNPAQNLRLALPPQRLSELEQMAPQLAVALGVAAANF